jgi:hypothetical protein
MENKIILETWFNTGLGDFYACLLSTKIGYDYLTNLGYDVEVRINSHTNRYGIGLDEEHHKFLNENFNLNYFKSFFINQDIPSDYVKIRNVQYAYDIYIHNNSELQDTINNLDLYGYSVENVSTILGGKSQPYPPTQFDTLLNPNLINRLNKIKESFGDFYSIHFRFFDDKTLSDDELNKIYKVINEIVDENQIKNIFISSNVDILKGITNTDIKSLSLDISYNTNYERVVYDLINMCVFSFSKKIYSFRSHWSNYLTYSLFNNDYKLKYEDFIVEKTL